METQDIYIQNKLTLGICELRNMVSVAYLMIKQSQDLSKIKEYFTTKITLNNFYNTIRMLLINLLIKPLKDIQGGDHSNNACFNDILEREAVLMVKGNCVIAGLTLAEKIFNRYDPSLEIKPLAKSGDKMELGTVAFHIKGNAKSILATEEVVLN